MSTAHNNFVKNKEDDDDDLREKNNFDRRVNSDQREGEESEKGVLCGSQLRE